MKKTKFPGPLNRTLLAVPAAALMLGAAEAGTTVGLNFQTWYYESGASPQTIGFNNGYSDYNATGFPVTAKAFGVEVANWSNTNPLGSLYNADPISNQVCTFGAGAATTFAGGLSCTVDAPKGAHSSGAGGLIPVSNQYNYPTDYPATLWTPPGETEAFWGNIMADDANPFTVSVTGLAAKFPSGYVVQTLAALGANGGYEFPLLPSADFSDGATTTTATYHIRYVQNDPGCQWTVSTVGLSDASPTFTGNTLTINSRADGTGVKSALAGIIITDKPVVTSCRTSVSILPPGNSFTLTGTAIGLGTLTYQWKHDGNNVGTNSPTYTINSASLSDSGDYVLVVTSNLYPAEPATSEAVHVSVEAYTWDANTGTSGAQDGSGTWNTSNANWWNGAADVIWAPLKPAVFGNGGTGAYTVTLGNDMTTNGGITFSSGTYTLSPATTETLTLAGTTEITTNANATIAAKLIGSSGLTKKGSSRLTLTNGENALTGPVVVNGGILDVSHGSGGSSLTVNSGATAVTSATDAIGYSTNCYTLNVNGGTFSLGVSGNGVWAMNTTLANATLTAVPGANWSFGGGSQIANSGTSSISGDTLELREGNPGNTLPITNAGTLTFNCPISGGGNLSFSGAGTTTLAAAVNTYTGSTTVNGGTLVISGQTTGTNTVNGGSLVVSGQTTGANTVNGGSLVVSGQISGATTVNAGSLVVTGKIAAGNNAIWLKDDTSLTVTASSSGTPAITTNGNFNAGTNFQAPAGVNTVNFVGLTSATVAPITVANLFLDSPVTVNVLSISPVVGQYPLMKGTASASTNANVVTLGTLPSGITATLVDDTAGATGTVYLDVTAVVANSLLWTGATNGDWDINTTSNWDVSGSPATYLQGDFTSFDDNAISTAITLNTTVNPASLTFSNVTKDYTLSGSGSISGFTSLNKTGAGTLTIATTNTFSGVTTINGGKLVLLDTTANLMSGGIVDNSALEISAAAGPLTSSSSITGTGTLTKSGSNTLTVTGGLALTTPITVAAGTLEMQAKNGDAPYVINSGGTLKFGYSTGNGYANSNLKIHGDGVSATTGFYLKGGSSYNVSGTLELLDAPTTIRQYGTGMARIGIHDINSIGLSSTAAASGSATDSNVKFVSLGYGMSVQIAAGANTATGDFILNGPLDVDHVGNGFYKRGAGSMRLNAAATTSNRNVRILGGTIICGIADCLGTNASLQINSGGVLAPNGFNQTVKSLYFGNVQQASGTWGASNSGAAHIDDVHFTGTSGVVSVSGGPDFAAWALANAPEQTAAQDHDNDGVSNGIEYFMGLSGSSFTANPGVVAGKVSWTKGATYTGVYGTHYVVQTSPDLSIWTDVQDTDPLLSNGSPLEYTLPTGETQIFSRLKVTGP